MNFYPEPALLQWYKWTSWDTVVSKPALPQWYKWTSWDTVVSKPALPQWYKWIAYHCSQRGCSSIGITCCTVEHVMFAMMEGSCLRLAEINTHDLNMLCRNKAELNEACWAFPSELTGFVTKLSSEAFSNRQESG